MAELQQIMIDSLIIAGFILSIAATAVGVGLILNSRQMFRLFSVTDRHISTRKAFKAASIPRDTTAAVQRYRWLFGIVFILGAGVSIFSLIANFNTIKLTAAIASTSEAEASRMLLAVVVESLRWFMLVLSALALAAGVLLCFFPQTLNALEARANRWYSTRRATAGLETPYRTIDRWVETHPRLAGALISLGGLIVILNLGVLLFSGR